MAAPHLAGTLLGAADVLVTVALWSGAGLVTAKLATDWWQNGRLSHATLDADRPGRYELPWVIVSSAMGACTLEAFDCDIWQWGSLASMDCRGVVREVHHAALQRRYFVLDQDAAREQKLFLHTKGDALVLAMRARNASLADCLGPGSDEYDLRTGLKAWVTGYSGSDVRKVFIEGGQFDAQADALLAFSDIYALGLGQMMSLKYSLREEAFLNGSTLRWTEFSASQHPIVRPGDNTTASEMVLEVTIGDPAVRRIVHREGVQIWELFGNIFGWVGVCTGMCLLAAWRWLRDLIVGALSRRDAARAAGDAADDPIREVMDAAPPCSCCGALDAQQAVLVAELAELRRRLQHLESAAAGTAPPPARPPTPPRAQAPPPVGGEPSLPLSPQRHRALTISGEAAAPAAAPAAEGSSPRPRRLVSAAQHPRVRQATLSMSLSGSVQLPQGAPSADASLVLPPVSPHTSPPAASAARSGSRLGARGSSRLGGVGSPLLSTPSRGGRDAPPRKGAG
eukprot:TRINITY_DN37146_c0_g1_i1.p1 TRINITY_DN37146_c0_g1~~TRINITY_DN37146_c0_g1_i1.p1  ORF type:complete len:536 (+),score=80.62 TRINITY_DN37146_c0_g1_i1:80-1609(+)